MVQEIVYAMIIGIQKQIALVCFKLYLFLFILNSYFKKYLADFLCGDDGDCNGKGTCVDSKCDCVPGWESIVDCHSKSILIERNGIEELLQTKKVFMIRE